MKYLLLLLTFLFTHQESFAQLKSFNKGEDILASDINQNSIYLKNIISPFLFNLDWTNVEAEEIIKPEKLNIFFNSIKVYKNDTSFTLFTPNKEIKIEDFNFNYNLAFETVKYLIPKSCKDLLNKNPILLNNDGQYLLDFDGFDGVEYPTLVYCDMTTNGGGWTNISVNLGQEKVLINDNLFGLSNSSKSENILNGSLVSMHQNNGCADSHYVLKIKSYILNKLEANEVKFNAKSYAGGSSACGGIMRDSNQAYGTSITKYNSFSNYYLAACANDATAWRNFTSSNYWHYSYVIDTSVTDPAIATLGVTCGDGYHYVQIKSIMIR